MDTENNHETKHLQLRLARGAALIAIGSVLMSRLPQLLPGQQEPFWYQSPFMIAGIIIALIGLLILFMPPRYWKCIWQSILGLPRWLREAYIWHKYGPKCILEMPVIDFELYPDDQTRRYSAKVFLTVFIPEKTRGYYPVRCNFRNMRFQLEQKHGLIPLRASLELNPLLSTEVLLNTPGKTTHWIGLSWFPHNNPAIIFVDIQKPYKWVIKDVYVYLDNLQRYRKLSRKGRVFNA